MLVPEAWREALALGPHVRGQGLQRHRRDAMLIKDLAEEPRSWRSEQCIERHGTCLLAAVVEPLAIDRPHHPLPLRKAVLGCTAPLLHPLRRLPDHMLADLHRWRIQRAR